MKTKLIVLIFGIFIMAACSSGDKQAKLDQLRKQRDDISDQIKKLEAEVASKGGAKTDNLKIQQVNIFDIKEVVFNHYIEVQGKLDGDDNVSINPTGPMGAGGVIKTILVHEGEMVAKDQILAKFDDAVLQKNVSELQTGLDLATSLYEKQKKLWEQKIGSEVQYLNAKTNKESLENRLNTLKEQMELTKIKSPIAGSVEEINIKIGQSVGPAMIAFRVVNFSTIKVMADVAESYGNKINKGDKVIVFLPDINKEITATIDFTSKYINPVNRTFSIVIRFPSSGIGIKANMIAIIKINDYNQPKAIAVPINIVQSDNAERFVFLAEQKDGKLQATRRVIKEGQSYNGLIEITSGLSVGDRVISSGYQDLFNGQEVRL